MPLSFAERADLDRCRAILGAGSKSFALASRLLPVRVRDDSAVVYAFCRVADDAIDECDGDPGPALETLRERLSSVFAGRPREDSVDRALARVVSEQSLVRLPFDALLDGFQWDVERRTYRTMGELTGYAARVAGTVGVLMTMLMGRRDADTLARACDLGVAMQLSNIARDVGTDARAGRLYLPIEWMEEAGMNVSEFMKKPAPTPALASVVVRLLAEADHLYRRSDVGTRMLPRRSRMAIRAARLVYSDLHRSIAQNGFDTVTKRAYVRTSRKLWLIGRSIASVWWARLSPSFVHLPPLEEARFLIPSGDVS